MNVYSPAEVARQLKIRPATLRKYAIMLEEAGYKINRNSQNHRYFTDKDIVTLQRVIAGRNSGITLDESINNVVSIYKHNTYTNDTHNAIESVEQQSELMELIHKQNELIQELTKQLDERDNEIMKRLDQQEQRINERDKQLMNTMNKMLESNKRLAEPEKKGFFSRLFNK